MNQHLFVADVHPTWRHEEREGLGNDLQGMLVELGVSPDGRISTMAQETGIEELDPGPLSDGEVVGALSSRLSDAIGRARLRMKHEAEYDKVTEDLFIKVVEELEEQHWMIRVQRAGGHRVEG